MSEPTEGVTPEWQRNLLTPGADQGARSGGPAPDGGYDFSYAHRPIDATEEVAERSDARQAHDKEVYNAHVNNGECTCEPDAKSALVDPSVSRRSPADAERFPMEPA